MNRGSEWHIWDLHVHTPESLVNYYKSNPEEDVWDKYIDALEHLPEEIKVIGINDYLFIDGYRKVLEYKKQGRLKNLELILPVVELRLAKFSGNEKFKRINFHVIFSNELTPDQIEQQFLNALQSHYTLSPDGTQQWGGVVTKDNLIELGNKIIESVPQEERHKFGSPLIEGFNNLNLEISVIMEPLNNASHIFNGKYITAIGKTEWDSFKWNDNSIAEKKNIINTADIVFTAAENIESYDNSKRKLKEQHVNDLLLDCSDAHYFADTTNVKDRLGNCKTWIKADPTFEGLKQILFEPDERVRIQATKPDEKNIYQVIDSITLDEDGFWQGEILLNPNLNTIIGGRSTGKSTLLESIAKKHTNNDDENDSFISKHLAGVTVKWKDENEQFNREIDYFPQSYMHDIASDSEQTDALIESIIKYKDINGLFKNYYEKIINLSKILSINVFAAFEIQKQITDLKNSLSEKGNKDGVIQQLKLLQEKVAELQKNSVLSKEEQSALEKCEQLYKKIEKQKENAEKDLIIFNRIKSQPLFNTNFEKNGQFDNLSYDKNKVLIFDFINQLKQNTENTWIDFINNLENETINSTNDLNSEIHKIENSEIFKKGQQILNESKELKDLKSKIEAEEKNLSVIDKIQHEIEINTQQLDELIESIAIDNNNFKKNANDICEKLSISYDGLDIKVDINFKKDTFSTFLEARLNQRGNERQEYIGSLPMNYNNDNKSVSKSFLNNLLNGKIILKNGYDAQNVATEFLSHNWYSLNYIITYQNDTFKTMSEGKQAFVILKLLLDFSDKKCPILIDQPEDSLDNRAIYNELVTYLKQKKKERQIILVTHNANVVVSADAENVIVANQHGTNSHNVNGIKFQYINGSLENTKPIENNSDTTLFSQGIRDHVCNILEGGPEAFKKREQKYGFKK